MGSSNTADRTDDTLWIRNWGLVVYDFVSCSFCVVVKVANLDHLALLIHSLRRNIYQSQNGLPGAVLSKE